MTSKLKCPFCGEELDKDISGELGCPNDKCKESMFLIGTEELWQALIQAKQDLKIAVDALGYYASENSWDETNRWMFVENGFEFAKDVLEQIEQRNENSKTIYNTINKYQRRRSLDVNPESH